MDIWAYTNCEEVELLLNGESLGTKRKSGDELRIQWRVPFAPGTLKAIGRTSGKEPMIHEVKTAGAPAGIVLAADRSFIAADGDDLSFVTVSVVDGKGVVVPDADNLIEFTVLGEGKIIGVDNGLQTSGESFKATSRKAFNGLCLAVIQSTEVAGNITVKAASAGLNESVVVIVTN